jgi:hypothetical protein
MPTAEQVRRRWSEHGIAVLAPAVSRDLPLAEPTKQFLCSVGAPHFVYAVAWFDFDTVGVVTLAGFARSQGWQPPAGAESYWRVGRVEIGEVCVRVPGAAVYCLSVDPALPLPPIFISSSIEQFIDALYELRVFDGDPAETAVSEFTEAVCRIDPAAPAHDETWWSMMIDDFSLLG